MHTIEERKTMYMDCKEPTMDTNIIKSLENKKSYDPSTWSLKNYENTITI